MRILFIFVLSLVLHACRHPIEIIGSGDVISASGERDCLLEEFQAQAAKCDENDVSGDYLETYFAVPREGWQFAAWGNYCPGGALLGECVFSIPGQLVKDWDLDEVPPLIAYFRREVTAAHKALLMGHSFFAPFSGALPGDAARAGFGDHVQASFFEGGSGGAPLSFWHNPEEGPKIKAALDEGGYTLIGMTYYPLQEQGVSPEDNLQGYRNWIDYALQSNSDFSLFVGMPWGRFADELSYSEFYDEWVPSHEEVHTFVSTLREEYPQLDIYCIPYGLAVMELNKRFEEGKVPDLIGEVGSGNDYMFTDSLGHPGPMVFDLVRLVWLRAIYGVNLRSFEHGYNYDTNLVGIADLAMNHHDHNFDAH